MVYPRYTGFSELLEDDLHVTHVVDLTVCYDRRTNTPWIWDIMSGNGAASEVHFHYKVFPVAGTPGIKTEQWLQRRWQTKERILARHYRMVETDRDNVTLHGDAAFSAIDIGSLKADDSLTNNNPAGEHSEPSADGHDNPFSADTDSDDGQFYRKSSGRQVRLSWRKLLAINIFFLGCFVALVQVFCVLVSLL